jgi:class 3 adenylate cyclase/tetratricopeptide (TPR) repeat protein
MAMTCPRCHAENREGRRFCAKCAGSLATACPSCGFSNEPGEDFCGGCAAPLAVASRPVQPRFAAPQSYTPKHLAEKILTSKAALEGERKQVTVLFADLKGSMELLADRDPEEARKLLDPVLERMMEAVHRYEGTVNQVMGDGIMALFGAPVAHEDHAVRACYAAVRMQRRLALYADELQRMGGTPVQIRVGLNSGEVVVRAIGSDLHMDYTALGQTTHLAGRMEQMAKPGSTLVTEATLKLAEGYVQVRPLGMVPVKGLETSTPVYELTGIIPARSRFQVSATRRGLTRFVGREHEVQQLAHAFERAAAGHGQAVAVVGEAGVGKSRLVWEFTQSHRTHGWLVLESGSASYGKATPYLPVVDLLKGYCRIQERDDPRAIRERVAGKLLMLDRALEPLLTPLLALLDAPVDDAAWAALDPPQRRQQTLEAVKRLLLRESQAQPLLLIFEDLHWIDTETQALLDGLMESLPTARVLLLVNYRPEYQHAWGSKTYYTQLRIDPLPPKGADDFLEALLGNDASLRPVKALLIERTEGNPFYLEESVGTLVETGHLSGKRGAYTMTKPPASIRVPPTVQAVLAARIDRLAVEEKTLLESAAAIGKDVPFALLEAVADLADERLRETLVALQRAELLYETALFPDRAYTFKHALTHEVAYGSLLQERRRALHARLVEAIERVYDDRVGEHVELLAHHALQGEAWASAVGYLRQAAAKAIGRGVYREAARYLEQALKALGHLPETAQTRETAIDVRLDLRVALLPFDREAVVPYLREAEALATQLDDPRRLGWIWVYLCTDLFLIGDTLGALRLGERALELAERCDEFPLTIAASYYLGVACVDAGSWRRAEGLFETIVRALRDDPSREGFGLVGSPAIQSRAFLALALAECGLFAEARRQGQEAVRLAERQNNAWNIIVARSWGVGHVCALQGHPADAVADLERAVALADEQGLAFVRAPVRATLGVLYARAGRTAEGLSLLEDVWTAYTSAGWGLFSSLAAVQLAEARLLGGQIDQARVAAEGALERCRRSAQRGSEAYALHLLGEIAAHPTATNVEEADDRYRRALDLAIDLGMRPLVAHCHLGLGKLYSRTGDAAKATEHLTTAATMYREMDMTFWLEKADAALGGGAR